MTTDDKKTTGPYGGFQFGSFGGAAADQTAGSAAGEEAHGAEPKPMSDIERMMASIHASGAATEPEERAGGPLVAGKEGKYQDLENLGGDVAVRFDPNELLTQNQSQLYMVDAKGAPHFIHPWTPDMAVKLASTRITRFQLSAAVLVLVSVGMAVFGAFTDREYLHLLDTGIATTATVSEERLDGLTGDKAGLFDHVLVLSWGEDNTVELHRETSQPTSDEASSIGATRDILVDSKDQQQFQVRRDVDPPRFSPLSAVPLLGVLAFANPWARTVTIRNKLKALSNGVTPPFTPKKQV